MDRPFELERLDNGLQLLKVSLPSSSNIVYLEFQVLAGRYYESEFEAAHFLEHLIGHWTSNLFPDAHKVNTLIDDLGARNNASVTGNVARYHITGKSDDLEQLASILINAYVDFQMDLKIFKQERNAVMEELRGRSSSVWLPLNEAITEHLFPEHPASVKLKQRLVSTAQIQPNVLLDEYERLYKPDRTLFIVVGDIDPERIANILHPLQQLAHAQTKITVPTVKIPKQTATKLLYVPTQRKTTKVKFLYRLPFTKFDEQWFTLELLCSLLTDGLSSRLMQKLRGELGLIYSISCDVTLDPVNRFLGIFEIVTKAEPTNIPLITQTLLEELKQLAQNGPLNREIKRLQNQLDVDESYVQLAGNPRTYAAQYSRGILFGQNPKTFEWTFQQMRKQASRESIQTLARFIFKPENLLIAYSGHRNMATELQEIIFNHIKCRICSNLAAYKCGTCSFVHYCSRECQMADWLVHQDVCV